ncbi:helix-turn-helix domain-containing protein [Burkholderia sp. AW49-1]
MFPEGDYRGDDNRFVIFGFGCLSRRLVSIRHNPVDVCQFAIVSRFKDMIRALLKRREAPRSNKKACSRELAGKTGAGQVDAAEQRVVVVFLSAGFSLVQAAYMIEAFNLANRLLPVGPGYQVKFMSASGGLVSSSCGVQVTTDMLDDAHAQCVHAFFHLHGGHVLFAWTDALLHRIQRVHAQVRWIADDVKIPAITVSKRGGVQQPAASILSLVSAADTGNAPNDGPGIFPVLLELFRHEVGTAAAEEIERHACRAFGERLVQSAAWSMRELSASQPIRAAMQQLRARSAARISIVQVAQAVAMSERNFLRRFKKEVGATPTEFVLSIRLERACHMLVHTSLPADKIARRAGLGNGERLAKLFRQHLALSPIEFRALERERIAKAGIELSCAPALSHRRDTRSSDPAGARLKKSGRYWSGTAIRSKCDDAPVPETSCVTPHVTRRVT